MLADLTQARRGRDVAATWLPLSHDMGIFGCLLMTWWNDVEHYLSTPERFMFSPATWFRDMAEYGCDLTAGTNTALHLAARAASRLTGSTRPIRARVCIIGAERVEYDTLRLAVENLGPYGLTERALMPAYGLAEATLAVTGTPVDELPRHLSLDSIALADGELCEVSPTDPAATHVVSAGPACTGVELLTGPADGLAEITVRSPSLGVGYHHDPERTARHFTDGVLHTSDLGFVRDGRLFPIGRTDDVIAVAGRKVYAREIETSLDEIDGVRHGCSTLVAHHDGSRLRLTLFIEARNSRVDYRSLARSAASVAMAKAAVAIDECVFLPRNTLPKTPTGKIQRHRCRHLLQSGRLTPVATVRLA
jgi:fatty-acyl-CoA synthase